MEMKKHYGFFAMLRRSRYIKRWCLMRSANEESVSEHAYETAVIAHALAMIGKKIYGKELNAEKIAVAALFHDAGEVITGDMPTPVKYHDRELRLHYGRIEDESRKRLISMLPDDLQESYRSLLYMEEDDADTYRYVKAADKLSAYIKCMEETAGGNREFMSAEKQTLRAIHRMNMPEAEYYLEKFAGSYSMNLDELTEEAASLNSFPQMQQSENQQV